MALFERPLFGVFLCISIPQNLIRPLVKLHCTSFSFTTASEAGKISHIQFEYVNFNSLLLKLSLQ